MALSTKNEYRGSETDFDSILQALLDLGGHNNLHIVCNNPNKIYFLLPNKTISSKWANSEKITPKKVLQMGVTNMKEHKTPFSLYITNGIAFCAYNCGNNTVWNPGLGFVHIPENSTIEKHDAPADMVRDFLLKAFAVGYVYIKKADVWKFKISVKSPCYYKASLMDLFWSIGVFLGYDENGSAVIDRGSNSTLVCRADQCVSYRSFPTKVDSTGQINDRLVNIHLI